MSRLFVGTDSDPRTVRRALSGLRAMVRLGRLASRALAEIESSGSFPERAVWVKFHSGPKKRRVGAAHFGVSIFSAFSPALREDAPDFAGFRIRLSDIVQTASGHRRADVLVRLPVLHGRRWSWKMRKIGFFRYTKAGGTFQPEVEEGDMKWKSYAIKIRKSGQSEDHKGVLSTVLSHHMVGINPSEARVAELSRSLRQWLREEGVVDKIFSHLSKAGASFAIVEDVMVK